jgi:hypothetical protein
MKILLLPFILIIHAISTVFGFNNTLTPISPSPAISSSQVSPVPTNAPHDQNLFQDPELGISFVKPQPSSGITFEVKRDGQKVYVYNSQTPSTQGQYLEVFPKFPNDTLEQALQKQFLANIDPSDCFVKDYSSSNSAYPSNFQQKTLGYKVDPNSDLPSWAQDSKCPKPYAVSNGISYFLADPAHPNIFLFVSIGQYGIPVSSQSKTMWQDTIQFL